MTDRGFGVLAIILAVCVDNMPRVLLLLNLEKMDIYIYGYALRLCTLNSTA